MAIAKTNLQKLKADLEASYPDSGTWHLALIDWTSASFAFTVNASTDVCTASGSHGFLAGTRVRVFSTGSLPPSTPQVVVGVDYLVTSPAGADFSLTTVDGTPIDFTGLGTGTHTVVDRPPDDSVDSVAEWIRKEVLSYDGLGNRPAWSPPASATVDPIAKTVAKSATITLNNSGGTGGITWNKALLIRNGSATRGNTSGTWTDYYDWEVNQILAAGETRPLTIQVQDSNAS